MSGSTGAWVSPAVLQMIAWELSMAVALPTSLLVDMPERQQVDVALQVSEACVDVELKKAVLRARITACLVGGLAER